MSHTNQLIKPLIDHLHSDGRLRVWSMVITIFGDAIQPHGGVVAMSDLHDILGALGVESGAVRTAMSRLAKEGWVTRQKQGRHSFYQLSNAGLNSFVPATQKIYRAEYAPTPNKTYFAIGPNVIGLARETQYAFLTTLGGLPLRNGVALFADPETKTLEKIRHAEMMVVECTKHNLPPWVSDRMELDQLKQNYAEMIARFTLVEDSHDVLTQFSSLEALCTRLLLVHEWRRLILKQPPLPHNLLPDGWPGADCHRLVAKLYRTLLPISEQWWDAASKKTAHAELAHRFSNR